MDRQIFILAGILGVLLLGSAWYMASNKDKIEPIACTMEAKICPDGTAVGRSGPRCEFAACPEVPKEEMAATSTVETRLKDAVKIGALTLAPQKIVADSRCPLDVQCIWAGTVQVEVVVVSGLGTSTMVFELGVPMTTEAETITLSAVVPHPNAGVPILSEDYRFTFFVERR